MSDPFIGEIRIFANSFTPAGWILCNGQSLIITEYAYLFSVIGNIYGGDGRTTFNVPNLNGRTAMNQGSASGGRSCKSWTLADHPGDETVTLTTSMIPEHTHQLQKLNPVKGNAQKTSAPSPTSNFDALVSATDNAPYNSIVNIAATPLTSLNESSVSLAGASLSHENRQPFLSMWHAIAYIGVFPAHS